MLILLFPLLIQDESIPALIEKLGSDSVEERERAAARLSGVAEAAEPLLREAVRSSDPEQAARARALLDGLAPYRREVAGEMSHLMRHARLALDRRDSATCLQLCAAMRLIDPAWESTRDLAELRLPPRSYWPFLRDLIGRIALSRVDDPGGSTCSLRTFGKLKRTKLSLALGAVPFEDVVTILRDLSGLNIVLDAAVAERVDLRQNVDLPARDETVDQILRRLLEKVGLIYRVTDEDVVLMTVGAESDDPDRY